jgi:hypothetical protein
MSEIERIDGVGESDGSTAGGARTISVADAHGTKSDENLFAVLAANARSRSMGQLVSTLIGSGWAAGAIWWQHPRLSWLGSALLVVALYATWGILDRMDPTRSDPTETGVADSGLARGLRDLAAVAGVVSAIWTVGAFMASALGHWVF